MTWNAGKQQGMTHPVSQLHGLVTALHCATALTPILWQIRVYHLVDIHQRASCRSRTHRLQHPKSTKPLHATSLSAHPRSSPSSNERCMPLRASHWTLGADAEALICVRTVRRLPLLAYLAAGASDALIVPDLEESRRSPREAAAKQWEAAAHNAFKGRRAPAQSAAPVHSWSRQKPAYPAHHVWMSTSPTE